MSFKPNNAKERISHRLKIVSGNLKKVQEMVEKDVYCIDIIHQSQAIQSALKEIDNLILEAHLNGCVVDAIAQGRKDEAIAEVMNIFKKRGS